MSAALALPPGPYEVIYADPPWRYNFSRSKSRRIENQYPTMTLNMYPNPRRRIELFARERAPGWDAWGNEVTPCSQP